MRLVQIACIEFAKSYPKDTPLRGEERLRPDISRQQ